MFNVTVPTSPGGTFCVDIFRVLDRLEATFDHDGIVANAGLLVPATLMARQSESQPHQADTAPGT